MFETGRNEWRTLRRLAAARDAQRQPLLRPQAAGWLRQAPAEAGDAYDEYVSDPAKPVPFIEDVNIGMQREYMVADQRFAARRPDVLVYRPSRWKTT